MHHLHAVSRRCAAFLAAILALSLPLSSLADDKKIDLYVEGGKLRFANSECPSEPSNLGCVEVGRGSKNWIAWELDNAAVQAGWALTTLQLDWDRGNQALTDCVVADFNVDPYLGHAIDFQVRGNGSWARNWDDNNCGFAYTVAYLVSAENTMTGEKANSDPIIKNGGRN